MHALLDPSQLDLAAYLRRIGYRGDNSPTRAVLAALQYQQATQIPFENLGPLLAEPVSLTLADLQAKLVRGGRGGFCYEHNLLLAAALQRLGFSVTGLAARVLWNRPADSPAPRTHMLLRVAAEDVDHLVDTGFGGMTPTGPLRLRHSGEQATPHEPFSVIDEGDGHYRLQVRVGDDWSPVYAFDLQPQRWEDYALTSWYLCHHPQSLFVSNLIASRPAEGCRHSLFNGRYTVHHGDGRRECTGLADVDRLIELLAGVFGISRAFSAADRERLRALLDRADTQ